MPIHFPTTSLKRYHSSTKDIRHTREDKRDYSQTYTYMVLLCPPREYRELGYKPVLPAQCMRTLYRIFETAFEGKGDHPERTPEFKFNGQTANIESPCLSVQVKIKVHYIKPSHITHKWYSDAEESIRQGLEDATFWEPMYDSDCEQLQRIEDLLLNLQALDAIPSLSEKHPERCLPAPYDLIYSEYRAVSLSESIQIMFDHSYPCANYVKIFTDVHDYRHKKGFTADHDHEAIYHPSGVVISRVRMDSHYTDTEGRRQNGTRGSLPHVRDYLEGQVELLHKIDTAKNIAAWLIKEAGSVDHLHRLIYLGKIQKMRMLNSYKYAA